MDKKCDLHTHSTYSDGTYTPREIVNLAKRIGLSALALTDHNTVGGIEEFVSEAEKAGMDYAIGTELSTMYNGCDIHIIALFIPPESLIEIKDYVNKYNEKKNASNDLLAQNLISAGYKIDYEKMRSDSDADVINRAHFATELIKKGYCRDNKEAFEKFLSKSGPYYIPPERLSSFDTIKFINSIGAVSVMAHPLVSLEQDALNDFFAVAKESGLDAIETVYSTFDDNDALFLKQTAKKYGFLQSGGSDYHGFRKPDIKLGSGLGNLEVPYEFYLDLKKCADSKHNRE